MKDSTKSTRVSPAQARVSSKPKPSRSNAVRSKNHLAWYVPLDTKQKQSEKKISHIPQIKWKCPPKIALNTDWAVAAGEESQEAEVQKRRESALLEVVYTDPSAIPPCPFASSLVEDDFHDDSQTPIIPIIPIEELAEETRLDSSATTKNTSIDPNPSPDLPISQCESLPNKLREVAAAVAAVMQNEDQIDTELLIKFLSNPEMIKKVMSGNGSTSKPEVEEAQPGPLPPLPSPPPAPRAIVSSPLPSLAPLPVVDKLANGANMPVSKVVVSISTPEPVNRPLLSPKHTPKAADGPSPSPRFNFCTNQIAREQKVRPPQPSTLPHEEQKFESLLKKYGGPNVSGVKPMDSFNSPPSVLNSCNPVARQRKVRPLLPYTSRHDEEKFDRLVKKYGGPNITGPKPTDTFHSPPSMLNSEAVKRMIHDYGAPDTNRATPPKTEDIQRTVEKYLSYDQRWRPPPFMRPPPPLLTPIIASPPSGIFRPPFPREVDLEYHKSLIKKHGEIHESMDGGVPRTRHPGNYAQGVERSHKKTTIETNPKIPRPCLYFGRPTGCRNGDKCLFQHNVAPEQWKMAQLSKKMKLNEQFGKWQ